MSHFRKRLRVALYLVVAILASFPSNRLVACSFCTALSETLTDELKEASAAIVATCESCQEGEGGIYQCRLRVTHVIQGDAASLKDEKVEVVTNRDIPEGGHYWLVAFGGPPLQWTPPTAISASAIEYLQGLQKLPETGVERLAYFLPYLPHAEEFVANDAYNEFARASQKEVAELSDRIDRLWVAEQLRDPSVPLHRRRLYWTFLSLCGKPEDVALFDELVRRRQAEATFEPGMDAAIACYITLGGETALAEIEQTYLSNPDSEYTDTYSAVNSIRVHGEELDVFPRERLAAALRCVLERPQLADLVLSDLARWKDWSAIDRMESLFQEAGDKSDFVQTAVIQYLKACPLPEADVALDKLRAIAPEVVKQVESSVVLFPGVAAAPVPPEDSSAMDASDTGAATGDNSVAGEGDSTSDNESRSWGPGTFVILGVVALGVIGIVLAFRRQGRNGTT